jgi:hypothetical protein
VGGDWAAYVAARADGIVGTSAPSDEDITLPAAERAAIEALAAELDLRSVPADEALRRVQSYFGAFSYSTFREAAPPRGTTALADFLQRSKSGHCEYFAAATTLLLRAAGIPARYATGFAMLEYSELEGAYVVRARHAHAWTRAWVGDRWMDVDTTPPIWFAKEERLAPAWQRLADLVRWAMFRWAQHTGFDPGIAGALLVSALAGLLLWRLARLKRAVRPGEGSAPPDARTYPGRDSEFYEIERALLGKGPPRNPGTPLAAWIAEISRTLDVTLRRDLAEALGLHSRHRFDPEGLDRSERARLRETAQRLATRVRSEPLLPGRFGPEDRPLQ